LGGNGGAGGYAANDFSAGSWAGGGGGIGAAATGGSGAARAGPGELTGAASGGSSQGGRLGGIEGGGGASGYYMGGGQSAGGGGAGGSANGAGGFGGGGAGGDDAIGGGFANGIGARGGFGGGGGGGGGLGYTGPGGLGGFGGGGGAGVPIGSSFPSSRTVNGGFGAGEGTVGNGGGGAGLGGAVFVRTGGSVTIDAGTAFSGDAAVGGVGGGGIGGGGPGNGQGFGANLFLDSGTASISVAAGQTDVDTDAIAATGHSTLDKLGSGVLELAAPRNLVGAIVIEDGALTGGVANALSSDDRVTVDAGASLQLIGLAQAVGVLAGSGSVDLGGALLTVGAGTDSSSFAGTISGPGGLAVVGTGTFSIAGQDTYTGGTTIRQGTLEVAAGGSIDNAVTFGLGATELKLDAPAAFVNTLKRFSLGSTIDLAGIAATSASLQGGTLVVEDGTTTVDRIALAGSFAGDGFAVASDSAGGTLVTLGGTYEVTSNSDDASDPGSLRYALLHQSGIDEITFAPLIGTIHLKSALPVILPSVTIDTSGSDVVIVPAARPATASATASIAAASLLLASPQFISAAGNARPEAVQASVAWPGTAGEPAAADPLGAAVRFGPAAPNAAGGLTGSVLSDFSMPGPIDPTNPNNEYAVAGFGGSGSVATLPLTASVLAGHGTA
jgi:hypothetical protein